MVIGLLGRETKKASLKRDRPSQVHGGKSLRAFRPSWKLEGIHNGNVLLCRVYEEALEHPTQCFKAHNFRKLGHDNASRCRSGRSHQSSILVSKGVAVGDTERFLSITGIVPGNLEHNGFSSVSLADGNLR